MMFVQPVKLVMSVESQEALIIPTKKQKTEMAASQTSVKTYHTHSRGNHAIIRKIPSNTDAPDQMIGAYSGFQASPGQEPSLTHAQPPNKTVVNEMMQRTAEAAEYKSMLFVQLVADQPVYALILDLKHENHEKYKMILPVMGGFHAQNDFMATIYKRLKGSGIFQLVHASDLLEEGSTDQTLRGAHHNRGMRCYMLLYDVQTIHDTCLFTG